MQLAASTTHNEPVDDEDDEKASMTRSSDGCTGAKALKLRSRARSKGCEMKGKLGTAGSEHVDAIARGEPPANPTKIVKFRTAA